MARDVVPKDRRFPPRWQRVVRRKVRHVRRSPALWGAAAVVVALVTASTVRSSLERAAAAEARLGGVRPAVVVVRPVALGDVIGPGDVRLERRPAALLPDGVLDRRAAAVGRVARADLVAGDVLVTARVAPEGRRGAAALLPEGQRAVAVPGGAGRPPLRPGDRVDVLATLADGSGETIAVVLDATVVDVDDQRDVVTVAVRPEDAPAVASAVATATVALALSG